MTSRASPASNSTAPPSLASTRPPSEFPRGAPSGGRFGTFAGVYTPSVLTILGVIMYLRFGWVVGNAGLLGALVIVCVSHLITISTGLSVSSIATNRSVGAGGAYYIISRSLGGPAGAAIGIPLFLGQALSVSFYVVGFVESIQELVPAIDPRLLGSVVCAALTLLSLKSAALAIKTQYVVMACIALSLVSFFAGRAPEPPELLDWRATAPRPEPFSKVFAVFFPAVTGIMAGLGMSGDLKNPRRALPLGTMAAIFTGFAIYVAIPLWLAANATSTELVENRRIVWDVARVPALIYAGVWGATLSSAIGSLLTAPRTLQALAVDAMVPRVFARGFGPYNEPRLGMLATFALAELGILLGNLDTIANLLTMFFLATYGLTNVACGLERWAASPSFRPDFRVPAWVSLSGGLACFYVMSVIDLLSMLVAVAICTGIYVLAQRRALGTTYGDARHGIWAAIVRVALHRLRRTGFHPQNWRPNAIIMGGGVEKRPHLLELGSAIVQDRGLVTYFHLLKGSVDASAAARHELLRDIDERVTEAYPNVLTRVDVVDDVYRGMVTVAQSYGLGSFEANTVIVGWPQKQERSSAYLRMVRDLAHLDRSLLLVHHQPERGFGGYSHIQIWWGGLKGNGGLMLLVAFLLTAHDRWRTARVSLVTVVNSAQDVASAERAIRRVLEDARLKAEPRVLVAEERSIQQIMQAESADADLAIIGLRLPGPDEPPDSYFERMNSILAVLPTTLLVLSARTFQGEPVLFDRPGK